MSNKMIIRQYFKIINVIFFACPILLIAKSVRLFSISFFRFWLKKGCRFYPSRDKSWIRLLLIIIFLSPIFCKSQIMGKFNLDSLKKYFHKNENITLLIKEGITKENKKYFILDYMIQDLKNICIMKEFSYEKFLKLDDNKNKILIFIKGKNSNLVIKKLYNKKAIKLKCSSLDIEYEHFMHDPPRKIIILDKDLNFNYEGFYDYFDKLYFTKDELSLKIYLDDMKLFFN